MIQLAAETVVPKFAWTSISDHKGESSSPTGFRSIRVSSLRVNTFTELELNTSETTEFQFEEKGYSTEVIYSGYDLDYDSEDREENMPGRESRGMKWQRSERE